MGEGELEALGEELLDVWAANVIGLLNLDNLEDLYCCQYMWHKFGIAVHTWISLKRDR